MAQKLSVIVLAVMILFGLSACNVSEQETRSMKSDLKQINKGIERFSELKNGTLEVNASFKSEKNAVESMNTGTTESTALTTFVLNQKGYDYIKETNSPNEKTGEIQYSAIKQVQGALFFTLPVGPSAGERTKPYEWEEISNGINYEPDGTVKMMAIPDKLIGDEKYIESIRMENDGLLKKYTVTTNDAYAKYMKKDAHSPEENFVVHEHHEIYWIDEDELLIKRQSYAEFKWTIEGISDRYISDVSIELTGCNYKKLSVIGDELPPMIMFEGDLYTQSPGLLDINLDALIKIGTIDSVVGSVQEPEQNNQANRPIKNALVYRSGKNNVIVKYKDYKLYEKSL